MRNLSRATITGVFALWAVSLISVPAFAQMEFSG